jgi:hypothetical protein
LLGVIFTRSRTTSSLSKTAYQSPYINLHFSEKEWAKNWLMKDGGVGLVVITKK